MNYLRGFLPWILFSVVSDYDWRWAALLALVLSVGLMLWDRRAGARIDAQILDIGSIVFFVALAVFAFAVPNSPLRQYDGGLSGVWLALLAWASLALRRPFTMGIARRQTPPEVWSTPRFKHTNVVITLAWTIALSGTAICAMAGDALNAPFIFRAAYSVIGYGGAIWFTRQYVAKIRASVSPAE